MAKVDPYLAQEKQWQKECDARTLADAEAIKAKPARLRGAQQAAKTMAKNAEIQAKSMNKIAKTTPKAKPKAKAALRTAPKKSSGTARVTSNTKTPYKRK